MKRKVLKGSIVVALALLVIVLSGTFLFYDYLNKNCNQTVKFSVGNVDSRFKISKDEIIKSAEDAGNRWNTQTGDKLLQYDSNATLKIELVYDQRQADLDKFNAENSSLENNKSTIDKQNQSFESQLSSYQADLAAYNTEVTSWNMKGGAPADIYSGLQQEKKNLDARKNNLISMSNTLNMNIGSFNSDLQNLKQEVDSRKNVIITQGLYIPAENKIQIYTFGTQEELRLVLMHELGHSLGLDHDQNQNSLMYYLLGNQDLDNPTLTTEDISMLSGRCKVNNVNFYSGFLKFIPKTVQ